MNRLMLRILIAALWVPVLGVAQTGAQSPAAQAPAVITPAKIAWISLDQVVLTCDEGKKQFAEVQKFVDAKNTELNTLKKESDSLKNQLEVQGSKLTDEAAADLQDQIEAKDTYLQRFQQDTQKEIDNRRQRVFNSIGKKLIQVLERVAKEKGLNAVVYYNSSRDAWVDPSLYITEEAIKAYNQAYPVSDTKAPAPAKKP